MLRSTRDAKTDLPLSLRKCEELANFYLGFNGWNSEVLFESSNIASHILKKNHYFLRWSTDPLPEAGRRLMREFVIFDGRPPVVSRQRTDGRGSGRGGRGDGGSAN